MRQVPQNFFADDAIKVARGLLGKVIQHKGASGIIVETEAYKRDPASHAYKLTPRSQIMADTYGHVYVYFVYGNYFCLNFTTNKDDIGAVLVRALEPLRGVTKMQSRRKQKNLYDLASGPGKLCQALGITKKLNQTKINKEIKVFSYKSYNSREVATGGRIGIKDGKDLPWRFFVKNNPFVSK